MINLIICILVELYCIFFFFFDRRNGISKQHEKQGDYLLYISALQYMDYGRGQIKQ